MSNTFRRDKYGVFSDRSKRLIHFQNKRKEKLEKQLQKEYNNA